MEPDVQSGEGTAEHPGAFLAPHPFEVDHDDSHAQSRGQGIEGGLDLGARGRRFRRSLRSRGGVSENVFQRGRVLVLAGGERDGLASLFEL